MKRYKTHLFITVSSLALVLVLAIQVNWLLRTAEAKEALFNEKAGLVLSRTADAFAAGAQGKPLGNHLTDADMHRIDSLLTHYMRVYGIHIDYHFEVKASPFAAGRPTGFVGAAYAGPAGSYQTCIAETPTRDALELKLVFPKKERYIRAEMGGPFTVSVLLIVLVMVMSWRTVWSLLREKRLAEHGTEFLNNMTHEFKTPLSNIALAGKMITKEANIREEEKVRRYSAIILEENEKLRHQVEQVLGMTAFERGEVPLRKTQLDMHALIHEALGYMAIQLENRQSHVSLNLHAPQHTVMGDRTHLANALCNLIDNAIKYSPRTPRLELTTHNRGHKLLIEVSDQGQGIDREHQKRVFDSFYRVPTGDVHNVKGFGLGLAYVKKMMELHGGTIALRSEKGKGTTFTLILPHA